MAYHFNDNVYTRSFTPREPNVELLDSACERNIIICLCNSSRKTFIATKLIQDVINKIDIEKKTVTLYVADSSSVVTRQAACIRRLTDLNVKEFTDVNIHTKKTEWKESIKDQQVLVLTTPVAIMLFKQKILTMVQVNLIIIHGCHSVLKENSNPMKELMGYYSESSAKPHILGLANSLFTSNVEPCKMEAEITKMENILHSDVETVSNVVSGLRYGSRPHEVILEYNPYSPSDIDTIIENEINNALDFLKDHRYDPNEIYEGFIEELQDHPDPRIEPEEIFKELLDVLHTLGLWGTDRAAFVLLLQIEKLKVTTPFERHFLLLCMASSVLIKIRAIIDDFFKDIDEKDRIYKFSSPKVLRTFEVIKKFQPEKVESDLENEDEEEEEKKGNSNETPVKNGNNSPVNALKSSENTKNSCSCNCELICKYLLKRLDDSSFSSLSFNEALELLNKSETSLAVINNSRCNNNKKNNNNHETDAKQNNWKIAKESEKTNSRCTFSNSNFEKHNISKKTVSNFIQRKNGYVSLGENNSKTQIVQNNKKLSEANGAADSDLQCHEYLLLPKFRVDRYARYDRGHPQMKNLERNDFIFRQIKSYTEIDPQLLCGLIFVEKKFTAKVLFHILNDLKQVDEDFSFLSVQFTIEKVIDSSKDPKGAENEHRKQEIVLKRFRMRECNLLIGTSFLEEGIDLPKCNVVIRFDVPKDYRSYVYTKERARASDSLYCLLVNFNERENFIEECAKFFEIEQLLLRKCSNLEPPEQEEKDADLYSDLIVPFCPMLKENCPRVDLSTAIALVNRYCAKLPSDTFTRLTPNWNIKEVHWRGRVMYSCSIRLPINSPVKQEIQGCLMPTKVLARRFAALQCCQLLHLARELDDTLQPISKESFWMREEEQLTSTSEEMEEMVPIDSLEPRPGTTKRRQYYYKKIADSLTDCRPVAGKESFLYDITMALTCPLPEEQNTRGRKIHAPEDSSQGFGIITLKRIPKIGAFPIFTRSGEVQVKLRLARSKVVLTECQIEKIVAFIYYTFTSVLRLQKYLMMFDPNSSENSYFVVPTKKGDGDSVEVDWEFLELIFEKRNQVPVFIPEEDRKNFVFDPAKFEDAVVSPWYRNQDQPQYFYVAEICNSLTPKSSFPGNEYETFEEYYFKKYDIQIQNLSQALLDVDHTSARLNFLTPRYVNRKGVALPTTSEEKKRAKRENLEQKQILIPELCNIHPFPATLWRKAVCLPCILHRINALLLADQVRRVVAVEIGVGSTDLDPDFNWKPLDFGWSLADVLSQSKALQKQQEQENENSTENENEKEIEVPKTENPEVDNKENEKSEDSSEKENDKDGENKREPWIEIGTWSNEMANFKLRSNASLDGLDELRSDVSLPKNVTMLENRDINGWDSDIYSENKEMVRYGSPTSWIGGGKIHDDDLTDFMSDDSYSDDYYDDSLSDATDSDCGGLKIEFTEDNVAEAVENKTTSNMLKDFSENDEEPWPSNENGNNEFYKHFLDQFNKSIEENRNKIINNGMFFDKDKPFDFTRSRKNSKNNTQLNGVCVASQDEKQAPFGSNNNKYPELIGELPDELLRLPNTSVIIESFEEHKQRALLEACNKKVVETKIVVTRDFVEDEDDFCKNFSFDEQPDLSGHPGPSPSLILQALTMSNANDGINLERLETIGDSFLKYAITTYLYCTYENIHEGKLSHLRSKQVSNFNLYRLGKRKVLGESMIATKFEPHDNWLPPCYYVPRELERALIEAGVPASLWNRADLPSLRNLSKEEISQLVRERGEKLGIVNPETGQSSQIIPSLNLENMPCFIPYNLMTQHSIPDKSIADCVEALIGAYLVACGPKGALLFMSWLGIKVLPKEERFSDFKEELDAQRTVGCTVPVKVTKNNKEMWCQTYFGELKSPKPPLLRHVPDPEGELDRLLRGFEVFEESIKYHFRDRSYLLQALTHASYSPNRLTDCYQRLEFLGDAVLDYLITRHLYEDPRHHSPGALTDLRSALVNNTIFASLAVRHNFHKYFRHLCPGLNEVVDRFVRIQQENNHSISEEFYFIEEDECEEAEDVEVPKALGDVFESVAGAVFLDSEMSLDAVWRVYYRIMKNEIELFSTNVPKSPIRELFELEPETAQFGLPEKLADGRRVRVTVEVFGKGIFSGIGRNYRIAKCTAAKCALKQLKRKGLLERRK